MSKAKAGSGQDRNINNEPTLTMLGTGSAFPKNSYNACFLLCDNSLRLLVDSGGGNGIMRQLEKEEICITTIRHFFITHTHTDHILGAVWIIRAVIHSFEKGGYNAPLYIYGNREVIDALTQICKLTLLPEHYRMLEELIEFIDIEKNPEVEIGCRTFKFFDVGSENVLQSGFITELSNGAIFAFLGDEALSTSNAPRCRNIDWVMCGAFCCDADADIFHPYEKHHSTVKDVARIAEQINVKNLILVHSEDTDLECRNKKYAAEAAECFHGNTIVPKDFDRIILSKG